MKISLGCDPEFFIQDTKTLQHISAHDIVKGTKEKPHEIARKGFIQVDGLACEMNTIPATNPKGFVQNINSILKQLRKHIKKNNKHARLVMASTVVFDKDYFKDLPDHVKVLGCDVDYDAYTGEIRTLIDNDTTARSAGGHLHIGWLEDTDILAEDNLFNPEHLEDCCRVVKQLDAIFWVLSNMWDFDTDRRKTYGEKGAFRPKTFGVEYRTLSNQWLTSPLLMHWIFETVEHCVNLLSTGTEMYSAKHNKLIDFLDKDLNISQTTNYYRMLQNVFDIPAIPDVVYNNYVNQNYAKKLDVTNDSS